MRGAQELKQESMTGATDGEKGLAISCSLQQCVVPDDEDLQGPVCKPVSVKLFL